MDERQHIIHSEENYPSVEVGWKDMLSILDNKMPGSRYSGDKWKWWKTALIGLFFMGSYLILGDEIRYAKHAGQSKIKTPTLAESPGSKSISENETDSVSGINANTAQTFAKRADSKSDVILTDDDGLKFLNSENTPDSTTSLTAGPIIAEFKDSSFERRNSPKIIDTAFEKNPVDSIPEENTSEDKWTIYGGLHWELQVPINGTTGYFDAPNTSSQAWRSLVPGIYIQAMQKKNLLTLEFNPMFSNMVPDKPFTTYTNTQTSGDSTVSNTEVRALYKMFGLSLGINYMKNITGNWWMGGTFQSTYWTQSVAESDVEQEVYINPSSSISHSYYSYQYKITDEWERFNKFQIFIYGDVLYRKEKWQAGIRTGFGVTPVANGEGVKNPFRMSAFYRWNLFPRSKKD